MEISDSSNPSPNSTPCAQGQGEGNLPRVLIITGLSGSGRTVALRAVEDCGYRCVDNLPPQLIDAFVSTVCKDEGIRCVALGIDMREQKFLGTLQAVLPTLKQHYDVKILFLEAERDVLVRRFKETRRPHPLMTKQMKDLDEAIAFEKGHLIALRDDSDDIIDTSRLTPHDLRQQMTVRYGGGDATEAMTITVMSFGFKFGAPRNLDLMFDVRFLPNPHFVPELRSLTGLDEAVRGYVLDKEPTVEFLKRLEPLLEFLIPYYQKEGKAYLTIGIGCTGGQHRSVALASVIAQKITDNYKNVKVVHRDL